MPDVGSASLQIIPSFKGFEGNLERGTSGALVSAGTRGGARFGESAGRSAGRRFGTIFRSVAGAGLVGLGALGVGAFKLGKDAIGQASDLNESLNAVNVTYGKQSKAVRELGEQAADSLGLSNTEFNGLSVRFSSFAKTISGGEGPKVVSTLDDLTSRASDFASVMNMDVADAAEAFQSGLAGEAEPLKRFGIDLSDARVKAFAYANGIAKTGKELTEAQKVQARYGTLMEQTKKTAGDFANTSDSLANRQRILNARWDDAQAKLGTALLPVMEDVAGFLLKEGIPAFEKASDWFVKDGIPAISDFAEDMKPVAMEVGPALVDVLGGIRDMASEAAPYVKDLVGFFNDLPTEAKMAGLVAAVGGYGALKLRGGGGGAVGGIGSAIGLAKPVPVFVTNPGFGGADIAAGGGKGKSGALRNIGRAALPFAIGDAIYETTAGDLYGLGSERPKMDPIVAQSGGPFGAGLRPPTSGGSQGLEQAWGGVERMVSGASGALDEAVDKIRGTEGAWTAAGDAAFGASKGIVDAADKIVLAQSDIPKEVVTKITAPGAEFSRKQALALAKQYDLTPREKRTLFRTLDIEPSKNATKGLQDVLARTPRTVETSVRVNGVAEARNQVDGLINALNNVASAADNALNHAANVALGGPRGRTKYGP